MVPAGPYEGIGGQDGFPRWADYEAEKTSDTVILKAKRSDGGLKLSKEFVLGESVLTTISTILISSGEERTSMGEHVYFSLEGEELEGLKVNGRSLDKLLG